MLAHQSAERDDVKPSELHWQPFVIPRGAPEAGAPGEGSPDDPEPGPRREALLGRRPPDHHQTDPVRGRQLLARVAAVDECDHHVLAGRR